MKIDDYTLNINRTTGQAHRGGRERRNKEENEHFTSSPLFAFTYVGYQTQDTIFQLNCFEFWILVLRSNGIN